MCAFKYYMQRREAKFYLTEYKGKISQLLDDFSENSKNFNDSQIMEFKTALLSFFDALEGVSGKNKDLALVSLFVAWDQTKSKPKISMEKCEEIIKRDKYRSTIKSGTSKKNQIEERIGSVYEQLSDND